jgi:hypothetical protein
VQAYHGRRPVHEGAIYVARGFRDRKVQRALAQFFTPENLSVVREALLQAGRQNLIEADDADRRTPPVVRPAPGSIVQ